MLTAEIEIAYIVYGRWVARGSLEEVTIQSGLITFRVEGPDVDQLAKALSGNAGVVSAASYGLALNVSGVDRAALEAAIAPFRLPPYRWEEIEPTFEDIFIRLMGAAQDNFG